MTFSECDKQRKNVESVVNEKKKEEKMNENTSEVHCSNK